jgi:hypothetical protein
MGEFSEYINLLNNSKIIDNIKNDSNNYIKNYLNKYLISKNFFDKKIKFNENNLEINNSKNNNINISCITKRSLSNIILEVYFNNENIFSYKINPKFYKSNYINNYMKPLESIIKERIKNIVEK